MLTCTCLKSHPDKPYAFCEVETVDGYCVHCGHAAVEFPDGASLVRPNHYLLGEAGHKFWRHCSQCNAATRIEDLVAVTPREIRCKLCRCRVYNKWRAATGRTAKSQCNDLGDWVAKSERRRE
jgi:hypothetical protein